MPHGLFKRHHTSGHKHHQSGKETDKVPFEEYAELQQELQDLREELDDASENLQLAKLSARTLEDHFRSEITDAAELRSSFLATEAQVEELQSQAQSGRGDAAELSGALNVQKARVAELETQHAAAEEQHKAVVSKLAAEAMSKASDADEAKARLAQVQQTLAEAEAGAADMRKSAASRASAEDGELQTLRKELNAAKDGERRMLANEEQQQLQNVQLRAAMSEAEAEAGAQASAEMSASAASALVKGERDSLRAEVNELRLEHAAEKDQLRNLEREQLRNLNGQVQDLLGQIAGRDAAVAELEAKLQLAELQQLDGTTGPSSPTGGDGAALASLKLELAERGTLVASLQSQLNTAARTADDELASIKSELSERSAMAARLQSQLDAADEGTRTSDAELASIRSELAERCTLVASLQSQLDAAAEEGLRLIDANTALEEQVQEMSDKNVQLSERLDSSIPEMDAEAMKERADNAVGRSAALLAEVAAFQTECESLRREVNEAADRSSLECLVEQATGRSAELLASLASSEAACDLLRGETQAAQAACDAAQSKAEVLTTELASAKNAAEEANAVLRDELTEAQANSAQTTDELREELAKECAGHSAAAAAADDALVAHTALRSEVAEAESAVEDSETLASKLQAEVQTLRDELSMERRQATAAATREQLATAPEPDSSSQEEIQELLSQVQDLQYALNITSEAAASDSGEPVGVQEARRFRTECAQLKSELQHSKAMASTASALREHRMTADFGSPTRHVTLPVGSPQGRQLHHRDRATPSFASCPEEVSSCHDSADAANPFSDAGSEERERTPTGDSPAAFGFSPPQRGAAGMSSTAVQIAENPFGEVAAHPVEEANPFEEPAGNPFHESGNPFALEDKQASPEAGNPFAADASADGDGGDITEVLEPQASSQSLPKLVTESSTPSFSAKDVAAAQAEAAAEVAHLRAALQSEEEACLEAKAACAEAREEAARGAKRALAAASGPDVGCEAGEVHQLRRLLSDEAAKSRRLCEQALRAEESRRRLLHEMLEDSQAEVDVVQLAKLVGRAAKAIAAVSEVAPVRPAEQVPAPAVVSSVSTSGIPGTSTPAAMLTSPPGAVRSVSAPEASASQPARSPQRLPCLPGLPGGSLSEVAVTPSRLQGIPGIPASASRSPRSMPTPSAYMDLR